MKHYKFWQIKKKSEKIIWLIETSYFLIVTAILNIIFAFFVQDYGILGDGIIFLAVGLFLLKFQNKLLASIAFLLTVASLTISILGSFDILQGVGTNVLLSAILFYLGLGSVYVTYKK